METALADNRDETGLYERSSSCIAFLEGTVLPMRSMQITRMPLFAGLGALLIGAASLIPMPASAAPKLGAGFHWIGVGGCNVLSGRGARGPIVLKSTKDGTMSIFVNGNCPKKPAKVRGYGHYNAIHLASVQFDGPMLIGLRPNGGKFLIYYDPWDGRGPITNYAFRHKRAP